MAAQYGYGSLGSEAHSSYSHGPPPPPLYGQGIPSKNMANTPPDYDIHEERQYIHNPRGQSPDFGNFDFSEKSIRRGFIRKVYSILMCQLLVTLGFITLFVLYEPVKLWTRQNWWWFFYTALALSVVTMIALVCCQNVRRHAPQNLICLGIFTCAEGVLLGCLSTGYNTQTVMFAVGITAVVTFALTIFSFQTKWDFTTIGGILFVALINLLIFGILTIFFHGDTGEILRLVYSCLGALLFSIFIVYDTQLMMGGKHRYSISPEEYIFASLNLYLDIVQLFTFILNIMGYANDR